MICQSPCRPEFIQRSENAGLGCKMPFLNVKFAETMKARGIARLRGAWIASDQNLMWCLWDTKDVEALQDAFDEMNRQSGLVTELASVEKFFPK